jgi:hypothetical protein
LFRVWDQGVKCPLRTHTERETRREKRLGAMGNAPGPKQNAAELRLIPSTVTQNLRRQTEPSTRPRRSVPKPALPRPPSAPAAAPRGLRADARPGGGGRGAGTEKPSAAREPGPGAGGSVHHRRRAESQSNYEIIGHGERDGHEGGGRVRIERSLRMLRRTRPRAVASRFEKSKLLAG